MRTINAILASVAVALGSQTALAQNGITYQGELLKSGQAVNDTADLVFRRYDASSGGVQIGPAVPINNHTLIEGRFTVPLDLGPGAFTGDPRWIEIDVRSPAGPGSFVPLVPRQEVTASPVALFALDGNQGPEGPPRPARTARPTG